MKVSIIITVYNVEKYLKQTIESALNQTYKNFEIIAVNDGSTDGSAQILASFKDKISVFNQENKGLMGALNSGLRLATGEFIAILDGDDIWLKDKLEKQIKEFEKDPNLEVTFGNMEQFLSEELSDNPNKYQFAKGQLPALSKVTSLIRKEAFIKYGVFPDNRMLEFIMWFDAAKLKGLRFNQTEYLVAYRRIRENSNSQHPEYYPELLRYLRGRIDKKRLEIQ